MHAGVSVRCRVGQETSWRSEWVETRKLFYIKCVSSVMLEESLDTHTHNIFPQSVRRERISHFKLAPMPAELDIEKSAGCDDLCSATTGSTLTPSHVDGSERRPSVSTSGVAAGGKCH